MESAQEGVVVHDLDGRLVDVNDYTCEALGYTREELIGRPVWDIETRWTREEILRGARRLEIGVPQNAEGVHRRRDGTTFPVEVRFVRLDSGRVFAMGLDISERQRAQEEAAQLEARVRHAEKLEAIGTLASGIAHDVSNHLLAIRLHAELAQAAVPTQHAARDNLEQALRAVQHSTDLIKQVMSFSRSGASSRRVAALGSIVQDALRLLEPTFPQTIDVIAQLECPGDAIVVDVGQIHQVVTNLLTNAVQAMSAGGRLEVRVETVELDADSVRTLERGTYVVLSVADTGSGMDAPTLERIFEPFFTTKEVGRGNGMGLSVVHGIVTSHGGAVAVDSERGRGTKFSLYFPNARTTARAADLPRLTSSPGPAHILFVDDDYIVASGGRQTLELLGYNVTTRTNPEDALTDLLSAPDSFDVVITDQRMPRISGKELAREMLRQKPELPVVLCINYDGEVSEAEAKAIGIRQVLTKPIGIEGYSKLVREILRDRDQPDSALASK